MAISQTKAIYFDHLSHYTVVSSLSPIKDVLIVFMC